MELSRCASVDDGVRSVVRANNLVVWLGGLWASEVDEAPSVGGGARTTSGGVFPCAVGGALRRVVDGEAAGRGVQVGVLGLSASGTCRLEWQVRDS